MPQTILIVEDNPVEQKIVSMLASRCGYAVEVAATGFKALDMLSEKADYAAVLMNYMLPAMNGFECTQHIRGLNNRARQVPIIAVTAFTLDDARQQCLQAGMDDYLSKPYTVEQFESMLNRWVGDDVAAASSLRH
ncbi:MAG TPA: response regulator [Candidatus Obscuribacterales bacterium]